MKACQFKGTRDPIQHPFTTCSPFNRPIGTGAVYAKVSPYPTHPLWKETYGSQTDNWSTKGCTSKNGFAIYVSGEGGAQHDGKVYKRNNSETALRFELPLPNNMLQPTDGDRHIIVFEPEKDRIIETLGASVEAGDIYAPWVLAGPMRDDGLYPEGGYDGGECQWCDSAHRGTRAYGGSAVAGLIRKGELENGLHHAVAIKAPANVFNRNSPQGNSDGFVWPATASDGGDNYGNEGNVFMGSLFAIPAAIDLEAKFSEFGITHPYIKELARGLQRYGGYIVDAIHAYRYPPVEGDDYPGCIVYMGEMENQELLEIREEYFQMDRVSAMLRVVTNNGRDSVGGGGSPAVDGACLPPEMR